MVKSSISFSRFAHGLNGFMAILQDGRGEEIRLSSESLKTRIKNLRREGLDASVEEAVLAELEEKNRLLVEPEQQSNAA